MSYWSASAINRVGGACLASEGVEELDGVDGEDGVDRARCCLQIGINVLAKELDNVDKMICRGHSKLVVS